MYLRIFRTLCYVCLLTAAVWAQSFLGTITGSVTDATGAVVQNAKVVLTEVNTSVQRTSSTNSTGNYKFADLTPGRYTVAISAPSFNE
jgi:hypothetical protein